MRRAKKLTVSLFTTVILALGASSISYAENCTSWTTYETVSSTCTSSWCNPVWRPSGLKEKIVEKQSRICNLEGGTYKIETRNYERYECNCD